MPPCHPQTHRLIATVFAVIVVFLAGCDYDVPLSARPDRPVDDQVPGNWISSEGWMMVRRFDAENYVVFHNGTIYRAWHSTVAERPFITLQTLDPGRTKYAYLAYTLVADSRRIDVSFVRDETIPKSIQDSAAMRHAIERHASDPKLLSAPVPFTRMK